MTAVTAKGYKGMNMEGAIARWYARNTASEVRGFQAAAQEVARRVPTGGVVLELAPGPGYAAIALAKLGRYEVHGLDISHTFVDIARRGAEEAGVDVQFRQGDATHMPYADNTFDFLFCMAAFKNFAFPLEAMNEMHRVLKPGGTAWIQDLRRDAQPQAIDTHVESMGMNWANRAFTRWTFHSMLLKRAYTRAGVEALAAQSRFGGCRVDEEPMALNVWLEKSPTS